MKPLKWWESTAFALLGVWAVSTAIITYRERQRVEAPPPAQIRLQDCLVALLAYAIYLTLYRDSSDLKEWLLNTAIRAGLMIATALLANAEACLVWPSLRKRGLRGIVVAAACAAFLIFEAKAVLLWWLVRTGIALFPRRQTSAQTSAGVTPETPGRLATFSVLFCCALYAVSFFLSMTISSTTISGWSAYLECAEPVISPFNDSLRSTNSNIPWMANIFFWLATLVFLEGRSGVALAFAALGLVCATSFYIDPDPDLFHLLPAYHLWLSAIGVQFLFAAVAFVYARSGDRSNRALRIPAASLRTP